MTRDELTGQKARLDGCIAVVTGAALGLGRAYTRGCSMPARRSRSWTSIQGTLR